MYDECLSVEGIISEIQVRGRYCTYSPKISMENASFVPSLALCVPDTCSASDVYNFLNASIATLSRKFHRKFPVLNINYSIELDTVTCSPPRPASWDLEFLIFCSILCTFVSFLVVCTICDEYLKKKENEEPDNQIFRTLSKFSLMRNAAAILSTKEKKGTLSAIQGLRFFSMAWIVSGHEYVAQFQAVNVNSLDLFWWLRSWNSLQLFVAPFAVDTFLTLTGFLLSYLFLKNIPKQKTFNVPVFYLYRYLRLAPLVLVLTLISSIVVPRLGSGPRWHQIITSRMQHCRSEWWTYILFIQNFNDATYCLPHLWYLSMDMQLFWIAPIILYPLHKKPKLGLASLVSLVFVSLIIPAYVIVINEYPIISYFTETSVGAEKSKATMRNAYMMPYARASPWLVGILCGFIMARYNSRPNKVRETIVLHDTSYMQFLN
ncbi:hypothetical protein QAD02_009943 [Eretmocerus hayati]|uniref:Uncharacterized protein n=1 Tax=Eretmocerus hayati TaxID=131215 RepID=A0ACC2NFC8_9HYME|nr:hypothetical protein QAD02_009943 [Eretmocerus hayati]